LTSDIFYAHFGGAAQRAARHLPARLHLQQTSHARSAGRRAARHATDVALPHEIERMPLDALP